MEVISLETFADKLNETMPVIIKGFMRRQSRELYKGKITLPQFFILELLHRKGESKMSDIARCMVVSTAAMTGIVDRLVRDKYVARSLEPKDRRVINVKLTPKGSELVARINSKRRDMIIKIFGRLSDEDRRDYLRILMQIREILTKDTPVAQQRN